MDTISKVKPQAEQSKIFLSWTGYLKLVNILGERIIANRNFIKYDSVYGIPRGGLMIAQIISYQLDIPITLEEKNITHKTLIVDDIVDSGKTLHSLCKRLKFTPDTASLHWRAKTKVFKPMYVSEALYHDNWIIYPYENLLWKVQR